MVIWSSTKQGAPPENTRSPVLEILDFIPRWNSGYTHDRIFARASQFRHLQRLRLPDPRRRLGGPALHVLFRLQIRGVNVLVFVVVEFPAECHAEWFVGVLCQELP